MNNFNLNAPIIPNQSAGGFQIGKHISQYAADIQQFFYKSSEGTDISARLYSKFRIQYRWEENILLDFDIITGQLLLIGVLSNYKGQLLGKISLGMTIKEALIIEPNLYYDDFEAGYFLDDENGKQLGISIFLEEEADHLKLPNNRIVEISIFRHELMIIDKP